MEKFVEHIIETDKRARAIIEQAQKQKKKMLADADAQVEKLQAAHEQSMKAQLAEVDEGVQAAREAQQQRAHEDYIKAKKELDARFDRHHDQWVTEIVDNIISAL